MIYIYILYNYVVVHAAVNAVANKTAPLEGSTIYLTICPDPDCAHVILKSKISTVKYSMFTIRSNLEGEDDIKKANKLLRLGGVSVW